MNKITHAVLVYQAGIANVFQVDCLNMSPGGRETSRLVQGDFRTCEAFARGLAAAGVTVTSAWCNMAGDITNCKWNHHDLNQAPFSDKFRPVYNGGAKPGVLTVQVGNAVFYVF